ncbi:hypothetical protein Dsin_016918 [Dipteronia sinensis]|uniref:RNase H type-1 domain-containing protein n=1 Tax=Dipteronia sinensis TaxID=43782 RepID=A0AAE0E672_9ROSI|nr:hypothetical protein Dsin_016918 [Dipteronia sinensis]
MELDKFRMRKSSSDSLLWTLTPSGTFTVRSFRRELEHRSGHTISIDVNPLLWTGVVPPKVDLFLLDIGQSKGTGREPGAKVDWGLIGSQMCPFCMQTVETIDNLFLRCNWTWVLWSNCFNWWGIETCMTEKMRSWMDGWMFLCPAASSGRVWKVAFHAICWTIWETRNAVVFNHGEVDSIKAVEMVRWRVACWFKNCGPGSTLSLAIMMMDLKIGCRDVIKKNRLVKSSWRPPREGEIKFNVDGSSRGNPGLSGIGRILRNCVGDIICMFTSFIGCGTSTAAEVAAILKACQCCESVQCPTYVNVIIESNSKSAVSWVNGVGVGNIQFLESLLEIKDVLHRLNPRVSVRYATRNGNAIADFLAKQGDATSLKQDAWL